MGRSGLIFQHPFKMLPLLCNKDPGSKAFSVLHSALLNALTFSLFAVPICRQFSSNHVRVGLNLMPHSSTIKTQGADPLILDSLVYPSKFKKSYYRLIQVDLHTQPCKTSSRFCRRMCINPQNKSYSLSYFP